MAQTSSTASWLLGFDASTPRSVIVVGRIDADGTHVLAVDDAQEDQPNQASARFAARIGAALSSAGIRPAQLHAVGCGRGPGTFTGTRVAVATAKGIAVGAGIPTVPVSTLAAVALSAGATGPVLALLDARRGEVYGGLVHCDPLAHPPVARPQGSEPERCAPIEEVIAAAERSPVAIVGPGVAPYRDRIAPGAAAQPLPGPTAQGLWLATVAAWSAGRAIDPAHLAAVYLRLSYAQLGINKPKRPPFRSPLLD